MQPTLRIVEAPQRRRRASWFTDPQFGPTWVEAIMIAALSSAIAGLLIARM